MTDAETIVSSLTGNGNYPTPTPTLATITTAINEFTTAIANAATGGTALTAMKNAKRAALAALLRQLASYVSVACNENMAALLTSGFPIQKPVPTPAGVLPPPATPVLSTGRRTGDLVAVTQPVPNAYTYNWRVALASSPTQYVQQPQTTAARIVFTGLRAGQIYTVSVNAVGSAGPSNWSSTAELMVV